MLIAALIYRCELDFPLSPNEYPKSRNLSWLTNIGVTSTFDSPDKSHHALDEQLYFAARLAWLGMEAQENKQRAAHWIRDLIVTLWWGTEAVMGGEAAGLCQCFHKIIFYTHWNSPTTTKTPRTALLPLPTSDKNQIITGVTYALSAWYFNLAFQLIHPMIKASIIYSLGRSVE